MPLLRARQQGLKLTDPETARWIAALAMKLPALHRVDVASAEKLLIH